MAATGTGSDSTRGSGDWRATAALVSQPSLFRSHTPALAAACLFEATRTERTTERTLEAGSTRVGANKERQDRVEVGQSITRGEETKTGFSRSR